MSLSGRLSCIVSAFPSVNNFTESYMYVYTSICAKLTKMALYLYRAGGGGRGRAGEVGAGIQRVCRTRTGVTSVTLSAEGLTHKSLCPPRTLVMRRASLDANIRLRN